MTTPASRPAAAPKIRAMIAEDSAVVRGLMLRWLEAEPDIEIVALASNGREAVRKVGEAKPDVAILDVEMPEMDGIEALPHMLKAVPGLAVIMASTLTRRNATITMRALELGAADYLPKPEAGSMVSAADYKRELISKIRGLAQIRTKPPALAAGASAAPRAASLTRTAAAAIPTGFRPEILVIGSSTGGPQALRAVLEKLPARFPLPILIVQHMPAMFTAILAEQLDKATPFAVTEASDGQPFRPGQALVAPGGQHMRIALRHGAPVIALDQSPPVNFCRPAVDPLFDSAAEAFGPRALAVVLTGMGHDGRDGARAIVGKGGVVLAQDEATSTVWGMPGAVAQAGLAAAIKPLGEMAAFVQTIVSGGAR